MYRVSRHAGFTSFTGFTLVELLVAIAVFGTMLAIGIPNAGSWLLTNRARGVSEFYAEGFGMARREAIAHNTASRISLTPNETSGQMDWQVDLCYAGADTQCLPGQDGWSSTAAPAANDPLGASGYRSVRRSAGGLPSAELLRPSMLPEGASQVYYTGLGWVNTTFGERLAQLRITPAGKYAGEVPTAALSITLAGMVSKCDPTVTGRDNRACPP